MKNPKFSIIWLTDEAAKYKQTHKTVKDLTGKEYIKSDNCFWYKIKSIRNIAGNKNKNTEDARLIVFEALQNNTQGINRFILLKSSFFVHTVLYPPDVSRNEGTDVSNDRKD